MYFTIIYKCMSMFAQTRKHTEISIDIDYFFSKFLGINEMDSCENIFIGVWENIILHFKVANRLYLATWTIAHL